MKSRHLFAIIASCLFFMLSQGLVYADNNVEVIQKKAMDAFRDGNYKLAEELLKNALSIEETDVLWLNLGRTYMRQNRCIEARNAYAKVNLGQAMPIVIEKYEEYQRDLVKICSYDVEFICTAPNVKIYVDNFDIGSACGEKVHLTSGLHAFREENASGSLSYYKELQSAGEVTTIDFKALLAEQTAAANEIATANQVETANQIAAAIQNAVADKQQTVEVIIPPPEPEDPETLAKKYSSMRIAGYTLMGVGVVSAMVSGIALGIKYINVKDNEKELVKYMENKLYEESKKQLEENPNIAENEKFTLEDIYASYIWEYDRYNIYYNELEAFNNRVQPAAITGMAVGGAIAATGIVLTVLGHVLDRSAETEDISSTAGWVEPVWSVSPTSVGGGMVIHF